MHRFKELLRNSFEKSNSELIGLLNLSDWLRDATSDFPNSSATIIRWLGKLLVTLKIELLKEELKVLITN